MRIKIGLILFLLSVAVSASGRSLGFCSTRMAGSEDKPFIISESVLYISDSDRGFRDQERIFQDCIERDHGYERSDASCHKYADVDTGSKRKEKVG